jgi:hypothetical protein
MSSILAALVLAFVSFLGFPPADSLAPLTVSAGLACPRTPRVVHGPIELAPVYIDAVAPVRAARKPIALASGPAFSGDVKYRTHWDGSTVIVFYHPTRCIGDCQEGK